MSHGNAHYIIKLYILILFTHQLFITLMKIYFHTMIFRYYFFIHTIFLSFPVLFICQYSRCKVHSFFLPVDANTLLANSYYTFIPLAFPINQWPQVCSHGKIVLAPSLLKFQKTKNLKNHVNKKNVFFSYNLSTVY